MPSENGWEPLHPSAGQLEWVTIPGTNPPVRLQFLKGQPLTILRAFAADFNAYVEPLRDADSAAYTATNSVATSNHLNGTGMDLNWNSHRFHVSYDGFDAAKIATCRELLAFYEQTMWWGQDWRSPIDCMHWNLNYNTYGAENVARVQSFIDRKIRADGFSTFRRGGVAAPPVVVAPPAPAAVDVLARATGVSLDKANQILVGVTNGLRDSQCTNVNRIAMWLAQMGHESAGFNATEEYASGAAYEGRCSDLGNCSPGDGVRFKGRSWIQVTGRSNYLALSKWANGKGIVPTPTFFVDSPQSLALMQYAGLGPAWYWTVARADINALSDKRDLVTVTRRINGGTNGLADRQTRYDRAMALGDQLLILTTDVPPQGDDDLSAEAERMIREMYDEYRKEKKAPSRSFLATDGAAVETPLGFLYNIDGNVWSQQLTWAYLFDVPLAIDVVTSVARTGAYEGSWVKSNEFNAWLNEFGQAYCNGLINFKNALVGKLTSKTATSVAPMAAPANATNVVDTRALEDRIAGLTQQFERLQVAVNNPPVTYQPVSTDVAETDKTPGQIAGGVVDSVTDYTKHLLAMDATERQGHLAALKALQPSNGDQA